MTRKLSQRRLIKLDETIKAKETRPDALQRQIAAKSLLGTPGTDFGVIVIPETTLPAATRPGPNQFRPGKGQCLLYKVAPGGLITPWLDQDGNIIKKEVFNLTTSQFRGSATAVSSESLGILGGGTLHTIGGQPLITLPQIDTETDVLLAKMDRNGKLVVDGASVQSLPSHTKIARASTTIVKFNDVTNQPGSGPVTVWEFAGPALQPTAEILTAFNWTSFDCPADELLLIHQEQASGNWMLVMDDDLTIVDGQSNFELLYPYETFEIKGDADPPSGPQTLGDIIQTVVTKAGSVVTLLVRANGDLFRFSDEDTPQAFEIVSLGETVQLASAIDETQLDKFSEWRASASTMTIHFGKVFDVSDDATPTPGDVDIFPLERLKFESAGGLAADVTKVGDEVRVKYTGAGAGNFTIEDERSPPQSMVINTGETLKLDTVIDEVGLPNTFSEFRAIAGVPDEMELAFGKLITVQDFNGAVTQTLFPIENLEFRGDRDQSSAIGDIIDVTVSKVGDTVIVDLNATGSLFRFQDDRTSPAVLTVDLTDTIFLANEIDETQTTKFNEWRVNNATDEIKLVTGKVFDVSDDATPTPGDVDAFPLERLKFESAGGLTASVTKVGDEVRVRYTGAGAGNFTIEDEQPSPAQIIVNTGDTVKLDTLIDEAGLPNTFSEFRVSAGNPENLKLAFGKLIEVEDDAASPAVQTLFPLEKLKFDGPGVGYFTVTKNLDTVTVTAAGAGSFNIEDERSAPNTITVSNNETLKLDSLIDEVGLPNTFSEFRVDAGNPELLKLAFGKLLQIQGFSPSQDGNETIFPLENLIFSGSRDENPVVGNIIDVQITKLGDDVKVKLNSTGGLFSFFDEQSPTPGQDVVNLGDCVQMRAEIDETQNDVWSKWLVAPDTQITLRFGRMLIVEDDQPAPNTANLYPTEKLKFDQTGSAGFTVSKLGDTVTVALAPGAGGGSFTVEDERTPPQQIVVDGGDTVKLTSEIEKNPGTPFTEFRVTAGVPEGIKLVTGLMMTVQGFSTGVDGIESFYPEETLRIFGDRDQNPIVGNFIDVQITKVASTVDVNIRALGDMFAIQTDTNDVNVAAGESIIFSDIIDKAGLPNTFLEIRGSGNNVVWAFGQIFAVQDGDLDSQTMFPVEDLQIRGDRDVSPVVGNIIETEVTKVGTRVIVDVNAVGGLFTVFDNKSPQGSVVINLASNVFLTSSIDETMTTKHFEWNVGLVLGNPVISAKFGKVMDVAGDTGSANLFPLERLHIQTINPTGRAAVAKAGDDIDVTIDLQRSTLPVGAVIQGVRAPIQSGAKWYIDKGGGVPDTDWALMDGTSNAGPGSGIDMRKFFSRGISGTGAANNTAFGRGLAAPNEDNDEVRVRMANHDDHFHHVDADVCHGDVTGDTHADWNVFQKLTSGVRSAAGAPAVLTHTTLLENHQGQNSPSFEHIEMTPPNKKLHYFERVAA